MADISLKMKADALGKSLENLAPQIEEEINAAVKNLAHAAYAAMTAKIQSMPISDSSRKDYLNGLKFENLGEDSYLIHLEGEWANKLESGFPSYGMREILLSSKKIVGVGPRTGQPWVQKNKQGGKFAHVPFSHHPHRGDTGDLATDIKRLTAKNMAGIEQGLTQTFKNINGDPMDSGSGKGIRPVAVVKSLPDGASPNLMNMAKFQKVSPSGKVSSIYMTWRTISEHGKDWVHPGHKGYLLFKEVEEYVSKEMDNIVKNLIK